MTDDRCRERLVQAYPSLRRFAAIVASIDMSPDDVVHDAIVAAMRSGGLQRAVSVEAYLRRAIVTVAANERRRLGRRRFALIRARGEVAGDTTSRDAYPSDLAHLAQLAPRARAVIVLRYIEGNSFEEIAEILDVRSATVRQIAYRARRQLRINEEMTT